MIVVTESHPVPAHVVAQTSYPLELVGFKAKAEPLRESVSLEGGQVRVSALFPVMHQLDGLATTGTAIEPGGVGANVHQEFRPVPRLGGVGFFDSIPTSV